MEMAATFDLNLVVLSVIVAVFASYVALNLTHSIAITRGRIQAMWLSGGSVAMGAGIWSMHFIGMLAFAVPGMEMAYDVPLMILSIVVAVGGSAIALFITSRLYVPVYSIILGGVAMAAAIAGMHYIGMASMRMAAEIKWDYTLVLTSILIALVASFSSLFLAIRFRQKNDQPWKLLPASVAMGIAISGMHYVGMYAATFVHSDSSPIEESNLIVTGGLVIAVVVSTLIVLGLALFSSVSLRIWTASRKLNQAVLDKSEERFRILVEAVKDYAIFMIDPEGRITTWNSGAERITGYSNKHILGQHLSTFYTDKDIQNQMADQEMKTAREFGHFEGEAQRVRKDGSVFWANVVLTPLYEQDGKFAGFAKVTRDITQFKEAELRLRTLNEELEKRVEARTLELQRRENQLRTITNALPVLIAQLNREERFLFVNEAFCQRFGITSAEAIGKSFKELLGEDRYLPNEPHIRKVLCGDVTSYERESGRYGQNMILSITFVPEFNNQNEVIGFILLATDITKHKEIEADLKNAKEAAEVANTTKSAFLANMSHEIRTPLGAILGFSEMLVNQEISAEERLNCIEVIKRNGRLLSNVINDILDLSKVEAGKLQIDLMSVPFSEIIKEVESLLNLEATEKGIQLTVRTEGMLPNFIQTDLLRLRQILLNIVGNAVKFTRRGFVDVAIKLITLPQGATKLAFVVKDTGEGIPPDKFTRLFTSFTQADISTTRKFGGTGLGLVLSRKLASALGGDVVLISSTPGIGSTFMITIDPGDLQNTHFQKFKTHLPEPELLPTSVRLGNLKDIRVLVVDDSIDNQILIKTFLAAAGAAVATANNGIEAVEKAATNNFSVILMDLQMPEMDGYEATKILRQRGYTLPIVALTAHAMKEERKRCLESGFDDHLTKPIDREALLQTLGSLTKNVSKTETNLSL